MLGRRRRANGSGWVLGQWHTHVLSSVDILSSFCPEDLVSLCQAAETGKASGTDRLSICFLVSQASVLPAPLASF